MTDERKRYPQGSDNIPPGYVLCLFPDGAYWVPSEPKWETPLTVERLVRVLRGLETLDGYTSHYNKTLIEALEKRYDDEQST